MISETNCPTAVVPAPPAVMLIAPSVPSVPASEPADPAAVEVIEEKLGTAPTEGALLGIASPCRNEVLKENASPFVAES